MMSFIIFAIFVVTMVFTMFKDATTMTIPNWISIVLLISFCICGLLVLDCTDLGIHICVGLVMFLAGFAMFAFGWLGGGDAKLMAATALWWQWESLLIYIYYTGIIGGIIALFILFGRKFLPSRLLTSEWLYKLIKDQTHMPYGLALGLGALITLPQSEIFEKASLVGW